MNATTAPTAATAAELRRMSKAALIEWVIANGLPEVQEGTWTKPAILELALELEAGAAKVEAAEAATAEPAPVKAPAKKAAAKKAAATPAAVEAAEDAAKAAPKPAPANAWKAQVGSPSKVMAAHAAGAFLIANRTPRQTNLAAELLGATEVTKSTASWAGKTGAEVIDEAAGLLESELDAGTKATLVALRNEAVLALNHIEATEAARRAAEAATA